MSAAPQATGVRVRTVGPGARRTNVYRAIAVWIVLLVGIGIGQRWLRRSLEAGGAIPIALDRPLSSLPKVVGAWQGEDVALDARVEARAANDDYVNRRYVHAMTGRLADFFLAYTASPVTMLGHRPDVCYPAVGWRLVESKEATVQRSDGGVLDCLIHVFSRKDGDSEGLVVLNYYVLQGRYTTDWTDFWGPRWRRRNLNGDQRFYVAQIQVVSPVMVSALSERGEETVKEFAGQIAPEVERLLPLTSSSSRGGADRSGGS